MAHRKEPGRERIAHPSALHVAATVMFGIGAVGLAWVVGAAGGTTAQLGEALPDVAATQPHDDVFLLAPAGDRSIPSAQRAPDADDAAPVPVLTF